jgi:hypothetical protein
VNLMEVFHSLDDDTVRRVFKMGALSESELRDIAKNSMGTKRIQPPVSPSSPTPQPNLDPEPSAFLFSPSCEVGIDSWMCKANGPNAEVD